MYVWIYNMHVLYLSELYNECIMKMNILAKYTFHHKYFIRTWNHYIALERIRWNNFKLNKVKQWAVRLLKKSISRKWDARFSKYINIPLL